MSFDRVETLHQKGRMRVLLNHTRNRVSFVFGAEHPTLDNPDLHYEVTFDEFEEIAFNFQKTMRKIDDDWRKRQT